jgi:membrane-anchored glycerophosphoryl diester phosphodiesterase (GDPDase)
MTVIDIVIKILLFFIIFYGAIMITAFLSKKIKKSQNDEEKDLKNKKTE